MEWSYFLNLPPSTEKEDDAAMTAAANELVNLSERSSFWMCPLPRLQNTRLLFAERSRLL